MNIAQKFLALTCCAVVRKMTAYAVPDITGFANINYFSFLIVEVIYAWCVRQLLDLFFREVGWQRLLARISLKKLQDVFETVILQNVIEKTRRCLCISTGTVPVFDLDVEMTSKIAEAVRW